MDYDPDYRPYFTDHYSHHHYSKNVVEFPTYAVYLIGFTMIFMLLAIIILAVALYLAIKKKQIFGVNIKNKEFVRQESTGVTLYNSTYDDHDKNNGSTLTMNSGIIEINRVSDPETPTRAEESKITFTKRPIRPIVPVMPRGQMDAICKEVLRKVQKSDSASFRDLNELLNGKNEDKIETKPEAIIEAEKEMKNEVKTDIKKNVFKFRTEPNTKTDIKNETQNENRCQQGATEPEKVETDTKKEEKIETKNSSDKLSEIQNELKSVLNKDVKIEVDHVKDNISAEDSESETEYDTVPSPIRYRQSGDTDDFDLYGIPVYDLLPRRSYEGKNKNVVQMDQESHYLLPLTADKTESCYINCKNNRHSYNSS